MKKYLFSTAFAAMALASCTSEEYVGIQQERPQAESTAIDFKSFTPAMTRATVGKAAADMLGQNFIVEGWKGVETTNSQADDVVFDNYLVKWGENTAGTSTDNSSDWKYVGVESSTHMTSAILNGTDFGRTVDVQTVKYWDYSTSNYAFVAYSTGARNMIATGNPVAGTSVKVTKINHVWGGIQYSFTAANAADFGQCYFTDVTPVVKNEYGNPVVLSFKNLSAKVRIGLYETIPGYSVKDVKFYADNSVATPATYASATLPADQDALNAANTTAQLYTEAGGVYTAYNTYDSDVTTVYTMSTPAVADPTASTDATFFLTSGSFTEAGTINVSYPLIGTDNSSKDGYNKADVTVAPNTDPADPTTKTFGALTANYTGKDHNEPTGNIYLGRTLAGATMAGAAADNYFTYVIPVSTGAALTLRCDYTLVSTDGTNEEIKVWGANAVVPANFCEWQPNYAYTYIFKISDNTNGSTEKLGGTPEGLFPITFDAVVADIVDAASEQTTVTTVATPSVTSYQENHAQGSEYAAGDIYVEVMQSGALQNLTGKTTLYTTTDNTATEADVINALQMNVSTTSDVVGRNGLTLTPTATAIDLAAHQIPAVDGTTIDVAAGLSGKFAAEANKNYVFVYDYTAATPAASELYSYDATASAVGATEPTDWSGNYYTKSIDGSGNITYTVATTFVASTAGTPQYYYKKYTNNNRTYAVKVIKTGTAYAN